MGKLMDIVGPLILLGGAIFVFSKRCEMFGMCGETGSDVIDGSTEDLPATETGVAINESNDTSVGRVSESSGGCCKCRREANGDARCQRHGKGNWTRYKSAPQDMVRALSICMKGCSGSGGSNNNDNDDDDGDDSNGYNAVKRSRTTGRAATGCAGNPGCEKVPTRNLNKPTPTQRYVSANPGQYKPGQIYKQPTSRYTQQQQNRSYFVDPNYVRPFNLYHRIAN